MPGTGTWSELEFPRVPSAKPAASALCAVPVLNYRNIDGHVARVTYGYSASAGANFVFVGKDNINTGCNLRLHSEDLEHTWSLPDFRHFGSHYTGVSQKKLNRYRCSLSLSPPLSFVFLSFNFIRFISHFIILYVYTFVWFCKMGNRKDNFIKR